MLPYHWKILASYEKKPDKKKETKKPDKKKETKNQ